MNFTNYEFLIKDGVLEKYVSHAKEIVVPDGVVAIGPRAFSCCKMEKITIPSSVEVIDEWAFWRCPNLTEAIIGAKVIKYSAFRTCPKLEKLTFTPDVREIGEQAFQECTSLKELVITEGVSVLGGKAFWGCCGLESVSLPSTLTKIEPKVFRDCEEIKTLIIDKDLTFNSWKMFIPKAPQRVVRPSLKNLANDLKSLATLSFLEDYVNGEVSKEVADEFHAYIKKNYKSLSITYKEFLPLFAYLTENKILPVQEAEELLDIVEDKLVRAVLLDYKVKTDTPLDVLAIDDDFDKLIENSSLSLAEAKKEWKFKKLNDGTYEITGYVGIPTDIEIPAQIDKVAVTSIGDESFKENTRLTSVVVPEGVLHIGKMAFSHCSSITSIYLPQSITEIEFQAFNDCSSLTSINLPSGITRISADLFNGCRSLPSITIPFGVTSIGHGAFWFCESFTELVIPDSVTEIEYGTFKCCGNLTSVNIPSGIEIIDSNTFFNCNGLSKIEIPDSVTTIKNGAFSSCKGLTSVSISKNVLELAEDAFRGCTSLSWIDVCEDNPNYRSIDGNLYSKDGSVLMQYAIGKKDKEFIVPSSVTSVSHTAFLCCDSIEKIVLPEGITTLSGFSNCANLSSINIPSTVRSIDPGALSECPKLAEITIPDLVESVGYNVFYNSPTRVNISKFSPVFDKLPWQNRRATNDYKEVDGFIIGNTGVLLAYQGEEDIVKVPEGVLHIGVDCFKSNKKIKTVTLPKGLLSIGKYAFYFCEALESINLPDTITHIGEFALSWCTSLKEINVPSGVLKISDLAFSHCSSVTSITLPKGLLAIGRCAFSDCKSVASLELPDALASIGNEAFKGCSALTSINIPASVKEIGECVFSSCASLSAINVDKDNTCFKAVENSLCTIDGMLIAYPCGKPDTHYKSPKGVTSIGEKVFYDNETLRNVELTNQVAEIGVRAFEFSKIEEVVIEGATRVGESAFSNCNSLVSASLKNVSHLDTSIFSSCLALENLELPQGLEEIPDLFNRCNSLKKLNVPNGVKKISRNIYEETAIEELFIPGSVEFVEVSWLTYENNTLKSVVFQEGFTCIVANMFEKCTALTTVTIPASVVAIEKNAFKGCPISLVRTPKDSFAYKYAKKKKYPIEEI